VPRRHSQLDKARHRTVEQLRVRGGTVIALCALVFTVPGPDVRSITASEPLANAVGAIELLWWCPHRNRSSSAAHLSENPVGWQWLSPPGRRWCVLLSVHLTSPSRLCQRPCIAAIVWLLWELVDACASRSVCCCLVRRQHCCRIAASLKYASGSQRYLHEPANCVFWHKSKCLPSSVASRTRCLVPPLGLLSNSAVLRFVRVDVSCALRRPFITVVLSSSRSALVIVALAFATSSPTAAWPTRHKDVSLPWFVVLCWGRRRSASRAPLHHEHFLECKHHLRLRPASIMAHRPWLVESSPYTGCAPVHHVLTFHTSSDREAGLTTPTSPLGGTWACWLGESSLLLLLAGPSDRTSIRGLSSP